MIREKVTALNQFIKSLKDCLHVSNMKRNKGNTANDPLSRLTLYPRPFEPFDMHTCVREYVMGCVCVLVLKTRNPEAESQSQFTFQTVAAAVMECTYLVQENKKNT